MSINLRDKFFKPEFLMKVGKVVLDSAPFIKGHRLETIPAEALYTVPDVIAELKDQTVRSNLLTMFPTLTILSPSEESLVQGIPSEFYT